MKIESNRPVAPTARRAKLSSNAGATFSPEDTASETPTASGLGGAASLNSVDALLALQGQSDDRSPEDRATGRAFTLLDILDDVKIGLLEGGIPHQKLRQLVGALGSERAMTGSPRLEGLLDEVETRARVELAKHESLIG